MATEAIGSLLNECQRSVGAHRKASMLLRRMLQDAPEATTAALLGAIDRVLLVFKREPPVERLVQFLVEFIAHSAAPEEGSTRPSVDVSAPVMEVRGGGSKRNRPRPVRCWMWPRSPLLLLPRPRQHLLSFSNAKDKAVRFRVCQLVGGVLNNMGEDMEIR